MDAVADGAAGRGGRGRLAWPRMTRALAADAVMWTYGAAMMCWLFAVILSGPEKAEDVSLSTLGVVFLVWALGTVPAHLVARLVARRRPAA